MAITNLQILSFQDQFSNIGTPYIQGNAGSEMNYVITYTADDAHTAVRIKFQFPENAVYQYDYKSPYTQAVDLQYSGLLDSTLAPNRPNAELGTITHESLGGNNYRITVSNYPILPLSNGIDDDFTDEIYLASNSPKFTFRIALLTDLQNNANPVYEVSSERITDPFSVITDPNNIPELPQTASENIVGAGIDLAGNVGYLNENYNGNPATWYLDSVINDDYKQSSVSFILKSDTAQISTTAIGIRANKILGTGEYDSNLNLDDNFCRAYSDGLTNGNINVGQNITSWSASKIDNFTINVLVTFSSEFIDCVQDSSFTIYAEVGNIETLESDSVRNNVHVLSFGELDTTEVYPVCGVKQVDVTEAGFGLNSFVFAKEKNDLDLEYYSEVVGSVGDRFVGITKLEILTGYKFEGLTVAIVAYTDEPNNEYITLETRDFTNSIDTFVSSSSEPSDDQMVNISFDKDNLLLRYGFILKYDEWINLGQNNNQDWYGKNIKFLVQTTISNNETGTRFNVLKKSPEFTILDFEQTQTDNNEPIVNDVVIETKEVGTAIDLGGNLSIDNDTQITAIFSGTNASELGGLTPTDLLAYIGLDSETNNINRRQIGYSYKPANQYISNITLTTPTTNTAVIQAIISKNIALSGACDFLVSRLDKNAVSPIITPVIDTCCTNGSGLTMIVNCDFPIPSTCDEIKALDPYERHLRDGVIDTHPFHEIVRDSEGTKIADRQWFRDECGIFFYDSPCCGSSCNNGSSLTIDFDCPISPQNIPTIPAPTYPNEPSITYRDIQCNEQVSISGIDGIVALRLQTPQDVGLQYRLVFNALQVPDGIYVKSGAQTPEWFGYFSRTFGKNGLITDDETQTFWNNRLNDPINFSSKFKSGYQALFGVSESQVVAQPPNEPIPAPPAGAPITDPPAYIQNTNTSFVYTKNTNANSIEIFVFAPDKEKETRWILTVQCL